MGKRGEGREEGTPLSDTPPLPSQKACTHKGGGADIGRGREVGQGGWKTGGSGSVSIVIANMTVGPNGCGGQAICRGASQEEAPPNCGRQSPPEGIP